MARYLVTGAKGGMGRAICRRLFDRGDEPIGIDLKQADEGTPWRVKKGRKLNRRVELVPFEK